MVDDMGHNNQSQPAKKVKAYISWPFSSPQYNDADMIQECLLRIMRKNIAPLLAAPYIVSTNFWSIDLSVIHATIDACDVVFLFLESHITEQQMEELIYAKRIGKPVVRITDFPKGD